MAHDGPAAAALLLEAAVRGGASRVEVHRSADWYMVCSPDDWLADLAGVDPFVDLVPFPAFGQNAVRPEVIVTSSSRVLVTTDSGGARVVVGSPPDIDDLFPAAHRYGRTIIFTFTEDQAH
ncbi:hypothetical protein [Actinoplanes sp. ATCC 53533]|uniref:hypothetical protein n=1 Tax=Actinoplanes sp. ATCC 53533 TaxID=1288362 RepID=UPI000F7A6504|nr:hypothetical protein [Actinoplanes sp. ATCC 53533]